MTSEKDITSSSLLVKIQGSTSKLRFLIPIPELMDHFTSMDEENLFQGEELLYKEVSMEVTGKNILQGVTN